MSEAHRFNRTRDAHRTELAEDYVEAILELIQEKGEARLTDLSERFGVAHPTVSKTLKRLETAGLVALRPYKSANLTDAGRTLAEECKARHAKVVAFLLALGVDRETAEIDAEGIEHHVSDTTLTAMVAFTARTPKP
ncbi:MAG: manganese-binding transcriptional regulator MntR [Armatimonadetes bacterium]|nr:manganese-binding transcriptional regulator MntR [Armatimonadota bacterium]